MFSQLLKWKSAKSYKFHFEKTVNNIHLCKTLYYTGKTVDKTQKLWISLKGKCLCNCLAKRLSEKGELF